MLHLEKIKRIEIETNITRIIEKRKKSQPLEKKTLGCFFKNPLNYSAGKLIDECGLKGLRIGGAEISKKHANFIINCGNAKFDDFLSLIMLIKKTVLEKKNIVLETEIKVVH